MMSALFFGDTQITSKGLSLPRTCGISCINVASLLYRQQPYSAKSTTPSLPPWPNSHKQDVECLTFHKVLSLISLGIMPYICYTLQQIYPRTITEHKMFAYRDAPFSMTQPHFAVL